MPKCDFSKVALQLYGNRTLAWVLSCKFAAYFQDTFSYKHLWTAASVESTFSKLLRVASIKIFHNFLN